MKHNSSVLRYLIVIGFFIILLLPILELPPWLVPPDWIKAVFFRTILFLILLVAAYQWLWKKNPLLREQAAQLKKNVLFWCLTALFAAYTLATIFSVDPNFSLWGSPFRGGGFINYALYIVFAVMLFLLIQPEDFGKLWNAAIIGGALVAGIGAISYLGLFSNIFAHETDQLTSTIGNPDVLGMYLLLLVFPALSFALRENHWGRKIWYGACFLLFLTIIGLSLSRGAYVGLGIGALYFLLFFPRKAPWLKAGFIGLIIVIVGLMVWVISNPGNPLNQNFIIRRLSQLQIDSSRLSAWRVGLQAIEHRPILGYGPENFSVAFDRYYDPSYPGIQQNSGTVTSWWDRPHDIIINTLSDGGVIALAALAALVITLLWKLWGVSRHGPQDQRIAAHGLIASLLAYGADLMVNFDNFSTWIIFFFIMGYSLRLTANTEAQPVTNKKNPDFLIRHRRLIFSACCLSVAIFIWFFNLKPSYVNAQINIAQNYVNAEQCDQGLAIMDKQTGNHTILDGWLRIRYVEMIITCTSLEPKNDLSYAQEGAKLLQENIQIIPLYTRNWIYLGGFTDAIALQAQDPQTKQTLFSQSDAAFQKAFSLSPKHQEIFSGWIKESIDTGNFQQALDHANQCIALNNTFPDCWFLKGIAEMHLNQGPQGKQDIQTARQKGSNLGGITNLSELADAYAAIKDYPDLAQAYQALIAKRPDIAQFHASLAFVYLQLRQYQQARDEAQTFLKLMPSAKDEVNAFLKLIP